MSNLLSDIEVAELTGYERASYQAAWLSERGIRYFINGQGRVKVLVSDISRTAAPMGAHEPDFGQFHAPKKSA